MSLEQFNYIVYVETSRPLIELGIDLIPSSFTSLSSFSRLNECSGKNLVS